jgi:hypothetical protein
MSHDFDVVTDEQSTELTERAEALPVPSDEKPVRPTEARGGDHA